MIAYPAYHGLGEWEPARQILEGCMTSIQKATPMIS